MSRRRVLVLAAVVLTLVLAAGLYWFTPWKLFTNKTVNDQLALPTSEPSLSAGGSSPTAPAPGASPSGAPVATVLAKATFVSHEHDTSGTARIVTNPDGTRQLELVNLVTSDGPDLRVWLSDQTVTAGLAGAHEFADGAHLELGKLKGNRGNQVYRIPADADLDTFRSVTIWCVRFSVSFGAAQFR